MRRSGGVATVLAGWLLLSGCDQTRLNQFGTFAAAGSAYVATFHGLVATTGDAMVASDSATLVAARAAAGDAAGSEAAGTRREIVEDDRLLRQYLTDLGRLDRHATLLGKYFEAVTAVTGGKAQKAAVASADGLVDAINGLNPEVEKARFGGKSVKDFAEPVTGLVVGHFAVRGLEADLKRSAPVIDRALTLEEAAVAALTEQLRSSLGASLTAEESAEVVGPYLAKGPLPADWTERRAAYLRTSVAIESGDKAKKAVAALHEAFRKLVAGDDSGVELKSLLEAIGGMAEYTTTAGSAAGAGAGSGKTK